MLFFVFLNDCHSMSCTAAEMCLSSGSFMKPMSQAPVNDWLTYGREGGREAEEEDDDDDGVQCFSLCLFKDARPPLRKCRASRLDAPEAREPFLLCR